MIPFLLVTSIVNIALGYALAVYLGKASARSREAATTPMPTVDDDLQVEMTPEVLPSPAAEEPIAEIAASQEISTSDDVSMMAPNELPQPGVDEIEHELLAGINDFRKQLAALRGQADGSPVLDPLAVGASS